MGRTRTTVLTPFTIAEHAEMGETLAHMRQQALGLRQVLREHVGSASTEYVTASRVGRAIQDLQTVLLHLAVGEHVDQVPLAELQTLYGNGEE
jgi:hypothetical protein